MDFLSKKLQVISTSAFAADMRNALEAAQDGINHAVLTHDIFRGPLSAVERAQIRDDATYSTHAILFINSYSLITAVTKGDPAPGAENSMLSSCDGTQVFVIPPQLICYLLHRQLRDRSRWCRKRQTMSGGHQHSTQHLEVGTTTQLQSLETNERQQELRVNVDRPTTSHWPVPQQVIGLSHRK